jgi:hypothetical protein
MPDRRDEQLNEAVSVLANALQAAVPLVDRVRIAARQQLTDASDACAALDRAATALRDLRQKEEE